MSKSKKVKIPKSVLNLRWSMQKYAKKNGISLKGKGMSKKEKSMLLRNSIMNILKQQLMA